MKLFNLFKRQPKAYHHIFEATDDNFETQVIQRSHKKMVMVDFWAAWCGPCRMLGPVLERMAEKPESPFLLAKLDTESNQRMAGRYNIRSIPAVKLFRNGQVVGEFVGVQMEHNIERFVNEVLADPAPAPKLKIAANPAKRLQQARQYLAKGKGFETAVLLRDFPESAEQEQAARLLPLAEFLWDMADGDGVTGLDELDAAYRETAVLLQKRQKDAARERLETTLSLGAASDQAYTKEILESLDALSL